MGETITIWPEGRLGNKIYRADGHLVWDDTDPSAVFPFVDDAVVSTARAVLGDGRRISLAKLETELRRRLPEQYTVRDDLARLLVEHGVFGLDDSGHVTVIRTALPPAAQRGR